MHIEEESMNRIRGLACLVLILPALACTVTNPATTEAPPAPTATAEPPTPASPLTADMLRNATYNLPQLGRTVTLTDGAYDGGSGADEVHAHLLDPIAFVDVNGDGALDGAVLMAENGGGTGTFVSLIVMLNQDGAPLQSHNAFIDDRPMVDSLTLAGGKLILRATVHSPDDPLCCPTFTMTQTWQWTPANLVLVRFTSQTPSGAERAIVIAGPADGLTAASPVTVQGAVTIAPFENTLAYRFYNAGGAPLSEGSIMVDTAEMGGPGNFNAAIPLPAGASGSHVRLELLDLSARDGSILAMDSVEILLP
jgi:hypothetical protein